MKAIFILSDTLNRRLLNIYHSDAPAFTPNIDRLARRGVVFDNHWCGSAPCMPARRDIMTGRLNFLEKPWGGMEPFDQTVQQVLSRNGRIHTQMFSDHAHYLIPGGENYTNGFTAWDVYRGQEGDPVYVKPDQNGIRAEHRPEGFKGVYSEAEKENLSHFTNEYEFPSVKTLHQAAQWLEDNHEADQFFLWAECFDPHEPYDAPKFYLDLYETDGDYDGADFRHPSYSENEFTEAETRHLVNRCKALMTMTDRHLGEIFDVMDRHDMWQDTLLIFTTDHGFHLGEHGYMAKNYMPPFNEVFHIPMVVCAPGVAPGRIDALTQNIDIMPTLMSFFSIPESVLINRLHGRSLFPLLRGEPHQTRDAVIYGYFGKEVACTDGRYTYFRAAKNSSNEPLYMYCSVPTVLRQYLGSDDAFSVADYDQIEMGRFMKWTRYPVYRFPAGRVNWSNVSQNFQKRYEINARTQLFDLQTDPGQQVPLSDADAENRMIQLLRTCMLDADAPDEQFERLGI